MVKTTEGNGRNGLIMWLTGTLTTLVLVITIPTMAGYIISNDQRNTTSHKDIRMDMIIRDEKIMDKMEDVKDIVGMIRVEQMGMKKTLEQIEKKL
jgi:hypothetical protein